MVPARKFALSLIRINLCKKGDFFPPETKEIAGMSSALIYKIKSNNFVVRLFTPYTLQLRSNAQLGLVEKKRNDWNLFVLMSYR